MVRVLAQTPMESAANIRSSSGEHDHAVGKRAKEIMDLRENPSRVVTEAERDFLTGVFNRKAFDKRLAEAFAEIEREKKARCRC